MYYILQASPIHFSFLCHFHTSWHTARLSSLSALNATKIDLMTN